MPAAFFAMSWNPGEDEAEQHAARIRTRMMEHQRRQSFWRQPASCLQT